MEVIRSSKCADKTVSVSRLSPPAAHMSQETNCGK